MREEHSTRMKTIEAEENVKEEKRAAEKKLNESFWNNLKSDKVEDFNDELNELATYLERNLDATGVYVGKLEP